MRADLKDNRQFVLTETTVHPQMRTIGRPSKPVSNPEPIPATILPVNIALPSLEDVVDKAKETGYSAGFSVGKKEGYDQGLLEGIAAANTKANDLAQKQLQEKMQKIDQCLIQISGAMEKRLNLLEEDLLDLVFSAVCRVLGEVTTIEARCNELVKQALSQLNGQSVMNVRMHPDDLRLLDIQSSDRDSASGFIAKRVTWIPDIEIKHGGCILETENGNLDARLEVQLESLKNLLVATKNSARV